MVKELVEMDDSELDKVLSTFIQQARNQKGGLYPGKTLYELVTSIQKHMELNHRRVHLISRESFPSLFYALDVTMKKSTSAGVGIHIKQAESVTPEQEEELWKQKVLDVETPNGLLRALFYIIGINFAIRGGQTHRQLSVDNFKIEQDRTGQAYLLYTEKVGKTRQGGLKDLKVQPHSARAYSSAIPERCPVRIFRKYISLCPAETLTRALYLKPLKNVTPSKWYSKSPLGHSTLSNMVKDMMSEIGCNGYFTNHSLRVSAVTRLMENGQDLKVVKAQTGHRSDALLAYRRIDEQTKRQVSEVIAPSKKLKTQQPSTTTSPPPQPPSSDLQQQRPSPKQENQDPSRPLVINIYGGNVNFNL